MNTIRSQSFSFPSLLVWLEGIATAVIAVIAYIYLQGSVVLFALLFLLPDVSMVGYLANARIGSIIYNIVHTLVVPTILLALGVATQSSLTTQIALIWIAHIGVDRVFGYGLKYATAFKDTHLQRL